MFCYRYKLVEVIGKGSICIAYLAYCVDSPREYRCVKIERGTPYGHVYKQLYSEALLFQSLHGEEGFPDFCLFGQEKTYNFLVMEALGPNLAELFNSFGGHFSVECVYAMAGQIITRLEALHEHGFVHRCLKPTNFLVGRYKKASVIYLTGLDSCKKYRDSETRVHIPYRNISSVAATPRYVKALLAFTVKPSCSWCQF